MGDLKEVAPSGAIPNLEVDAIDEILFDQDHKLMKIWLYKFLQMQVYLVQLVLQILTNASIFYLLNISQD